MDRQERCREYAGRLSRTLKYEGQRSLALLIQGPTQPGKFDRAAAMAHVVSKPGLPFGQLGRGESVTLPSGEVVHPECCVGPKRPSPATLILDLLSLAMFNAAKANVQRLVELMKRAEAPGVQSVVHMISSELLGVKRAEEYFRILSGLSAAYGNKDLKHIFSGTNNAILMSSSMKLQKTLSETLKSSFFPSGQQATNFICNLSSGIVAKPFDKLSLSPKNPFPLNQPSIGRNMKLKLRILPKILMKRNLHFNTGNRFSYSRKVSQCQFFLDWE